MKTAILSSLVLGLSLTACIDAAEDGGEVGTTNTNKIAMNALPPSGLVLAVPSTQLTNSSAATQISTSNGRLALLYFASCALGPSQTFTSGGYSFPGSMGLASDWTSIGGMSASEASAVSSCVIGRLNRDGISVSISLRGANTGFATVGTETSAYNLEDGAFFGNLFHDQGAIAQYTCEGVDKVATPDLGDLANRHCTEPGVWPSPNACNLTQIGNCASVCTSVSGYYTCTVGTTNYTDAATAFVRQYPGR